MYQPVVGSAVPLGPVCQRTVVCYSLGCLGSASWPIRVCGVSWVLGGRVVVPAVQSAGSGSSYTAAYSASSSFVAGGERSCESDPERARGVHPFRPLLVRRVGEDPLDLLVARMHAQHRDRAYGSPSCSCVSSRRVARIRPLRPMYSRSTVWMRSITASIRSRGTASSFVRGGFRPARGVCRGWFRVATPCSRSCSISVVWLFRTQRSCGADSFNFRRLRSGRVSRWMSAPEAALRVGVARRFRGGGSCR